MTLTLEATARPMTRKAEALRKEGRVPAVVYGPKTENIPLSVDARAFQKVWKEAGETTVIGVSVDDKTIDVLVQEVAVHPVSGDPMHADFYAVDKTKKVEVNIPLSFEGVAPAVKDLGGTLVKVLHEITVSGLPGNLPNEVVVDTVLLKELDSVITVKDVVLPEGVVAAMPEDDVVVSVSVQEEEPEETTEEVDLESIEVEQKGKKEEGEGEEKGE
ncbi:MAG: 50S ribosomal protein L25 [Parcubacteria group bacterium]|nr:50S ribosomal protein L25 [Parcubacteria group bacterium]